MLERQRQATATLEQLESTQKQADRVAMTGFTGND